MKEQTTKIMKILRFADPIWNLKNDNNSLYDEFVKEIDNYELDELDTLENFANFLLSKKIDTNYIFEILEYLTNLNPKGLSSNELYQGFFYGYFYATYLDPCEYQKETIIYDVMKKEFLTNNLENFDLEWESEHRDEILESKLNWMDIDEFIRFNSNSDNSFNLKYFLLKKSNQDLDDKIREILNMIDTNKSNDITIKEMIIEFIE